MALASDLIECTVGTEKRIVGWVWTFPAFPVIPLSEIPTHVNTCLLLPAQGSHELEELIRPRGHFTSLFSGFCWAGPSQQPLRVESQQHLAIRIKSRHTKLRLQVIRGLNFVFRSRTNSQRNIYPFTRPSACNTSGTPPRHGLLGHVSFLLAVSFTSELPNTIVSTRHIC